MNKKEISKMDMYIEDMCIEDSPAQAIRLIRELLDNLEEDIYGGD